MDAPPSRDSTRTENESKRLNFLNGTSTHCVNQKDPKKRTIRVTNGRLFRDGKVGLQIPFHLD